MTYFDDEDICKTYRQGGEGWGHEEPIFDSLIALVIHQVMVARHKPTQRLHFHCNNQFFHMKYIFPSSVCWLWAMPVPNAWTIVGERTRTVLQLNVKFSECQGKLAVIRMRHVTSTRTGQSFRWFSTILYTHITFWRSQRKVYCMLRKQ